MGLLAELLAIDQRQTLEFFVTSLKDVSGPVVDRQELFYNASVLAHFAQVPVDLDDEMATPANLSAIFDHFVAGTSKLSEPGMMETAGAQCLLMAGFFEDQMRRRHNIRWYSELGAGFFRRAAADEPSAEKAHLLVLMGLHFELWRQRHARLSHELRDAPYLLGRVRPSRN